MKPTIKLILRVTDNGEGFEEGVDVAFLELTPEFKALILNARKHLRLLKETLNSSVYDIRMFGYEPKFLANGQFEEVVSLKLSESVAETGRCFIKTENQLKKIAKCQTARTDVVLLQITDHSFFWSGYYKHTDIRFTTEAVSISELEN